VTEFINFYFIPGLVLGSIYALGAIGITLTFGILRFANFAHGESMTLGAYFAFTMVQYTGFHPLVVLPGAMLLTIGLMLFLDRFFYKPFRSSHAIMLVMASFGLMLMIRSVIQFIWGVQLKTMIPGIQMPSVYFGWLRLSSKHVLIIVSALILVYMVHFLLSRTKIGKAMRAMADSPELARLTGINTESVIRTTWIVGGGLGAAAGVFLAIDTHVETMMGFKLLLPMFAAAILGGVGRPYGAVLGGLIIGFAEELSSYPVFGSTPLIDPGYKAGIAFVIMIGMLIWRPTGLLKGQA